MEDLALTQNHPSPEFWRGKKVLLTGHTGFKGSWLALWLTRMEADVTGIALPPATDPDLFTLADIGASIKSHHIDIRDAETLARCVVSANPEIVLHLAAQPLVRASYRDPLSTFSTNIQGTANLLEALRQLKSLRVVVAITTDKVYRNLEHSFPYRETDVLGGHDPYSASKAAAELVIASYRDAFLAGQGVAVASARAGNVIGGGDWSEDRLIPDAVRAWSNGKSLTIRHPNAIRPWQHVLDPLSAYLQLAECLWAAHNLAGAYNFGPLTHETATVREVIELAREVYGGGDILWGDGTEGPHEAGWLILEIAKAREALRVQPRWSLQQAVAHTLRWYRARQSGENVRELCQADINAFIQAP